MSQMVSCKTHVPYKECGKKGYLPCERKGSGASKINVKNYGNFQSLEPLAVTFGKYGFCLALLWRVLHKTSDNSSYTFSALKLFYNNLRHFHASNIK